MMTCLHPAKSTRAPRGRTSSRLLRFGIRIACELTELLRLPRRFWKTTLIVLPLTLYLALHYRVNITPSMPWTLARVEYGRMPQIGEYMLYEYRGAMEHLPSRTFFKRVVGGPGDAIRVQGRTVWVGDLLIGEAMHETRDGRPLSVISAGRIPDGYLFAKGDHASSFDSRYRESGLVPLDAVIGIAYPVF